MIVQLIIAVVLLILGILIRTNKFNCLIAGLNTMSKDGKDTVNQNKLSKFIGNLLIILSGVNVIIAFLYYYGYSNFELYTSFIQLMLIAGCIVYINVGNKFSNKEK